MDPNQQQLLLTGGAKKDTTYVDDVFSTHVYTGNANLYKLNYITNGVRLGTSNFGNSTLFTAEDEEIRYGDSQDWYFDNNDFTKVGDLIAETLDGLQNNPEDNSKTEENVRKQVKELCDKYPIYI